MNGKHRKVSSQPSSCSQNTESSSTTPEPTNESSDNEGNPNPPPNTHRQTLKKIKMHERTPRFCLSRFNKAVLTVQ